MVMCKVYAFFAFDPVHADTSHLTQENILETSWQWLLEKVLNIKPDK